jgi:molecular chaperone GrpE
MNEDLKVIDEQGEPPADTATSDSPAGTAACDDVKAERDKFYDLLLRKTAEFDNYRKRLERERQSWTEGAIGDVIGDLLPVIDDLERALKVEAVGEEGLAYRKGVELIHRRLLDVLKRRNVTVVDAVGQPFDPHLHQAVTYEPADGKPDGEIVEEFARGYLIGERLLRPAMVKVAKA